VSWPPALADGYRFESDPAVWDRDAMHAFLSQTYWTPGLDRARMERGIDNSLGIALFADAVQVGFARVVTDRARFAYLCDVYVLPEHCGQGLARAMVGWLHGHPELAEVSRWLLFTRDAHGVYEALGYGPPDDAAGLMQRRVPQ
jgi:GNAT superfamily N-acetyltransferase